jgi:peptide/nickel transport system permease protein
MSSTMKIILLTGPLGAGKSTALRILAELGYATLDADVLAHHVLQRGTSGYQQILERFGPAILDGRGEIDRLQLNRIARADSRASSEIRSIIFPLVRQQVQELARQAETPTLFVKTHDPNAYELQGLAHQVWVLSATDNERLADLVDRHGWSREAALRFVRSARQRAPAPQGGDIEIQSGDAGPELKEQISRALEALGLQPPSSVKPLIPTSSQSASIAIVRPDSASALPGLSSPLMQGEELTIAAAPATPSLVERSSQAETPSLGTVVPSLGMREVRLMGRRILGSIVILLSIAFLTSWGLILAEVGRLHQPILPMQAAGQALTNTVHYIVAHPSSYYWEKVETPWLSLIGETLRNSAGLLLLSMITAILAGFPLGMAAATSKRGPESALMVLLSVAGASTPSFLFAMMLWAANIWVHRTFDIRVLPATGFGWDAHVIMPVLVLAMRPLAQVAQITYVSVQEALGQDYIRTAHSKGLTWRAVRNVHLLPNVFIPILNTLGTSLRFSLASLPIVEVFFNWPGVGSRLLDAIDLGTAPLVMDLILSLGLFFLFINLLIEFSFPLIDPRLRSESIEESRSESGTITDWVRQAGEIFSAWYGDIRDRVLRRQKHDLPPLPSTLQTNLAAPEAVSTVQRHSVLRNTLRNPAFIVGMLLLLGLGCLAIFGGQLPGVDAYQIHGVMAVAGKISAPPFKPSPEFPWGSDHIGRDIRSLVLAGAGRTLSLVFFGMLARLVVGASLGLLAGWQRGSWFDRLVSGATGIWAAFPATLFAMIVIQALGIQQGMWVFIVAISLVGWGEVAQIVRAHVVALKPQAYIESARSIGSRADQVLIRHVVPNLINPLTVLAALEMGGILMLLAELGFLNIFMGGGFRAMIGESGSMVPVVAYYSDVPEWSALIANVRAYWRSYPWMALYPGMAVFLSIMTFNLLGEGLRHFLEDNAIGLGRFLNRYTLVAAAGVALVVALVLSSATPLNVYREEGLRFDAAHALEDTRTLSDPFFQGRETGTPGADLAAIYIAQRMAEVGLFPAGEHNSYYQRLIQPRTHLLGLPTFELLDGSGDVMRQFDYHQDFTEMARDPQSHGEAEGRIIGAAFGPMLESETNSQYGLSDTQAMDHVLIVRADDASKVVTKQVSAVLVVADTPTDLLRRDVYPYIQSWYENKRPFLLISTRVAELLLATAGSSMADLDAKRESLAPGTLVLTSEGASVRISVPADINENMLDEAYVNVIGEIPGQGHFMGTEQQVVVVSAYYDGLGTDPEGVIYPGANDNASGVAVMLELARLLKTSAYQPDKSVLFVAWAGGERREGLSTVNILNARPGASELTVETVVELSGVGYGTGTEMSIGNDSSFRLVQLFQQAASRYNTRTTTLGRGPHYDLPVSSIFGGRSATTLSVSWDGSDNLAHTPNDTFALIDVKKLQQVGQSVYLTLLVLSRETEY